MVWPGSGALRLARAGSLALAAYGLALGAHLVGGGDAPSAIASVVILFATFWACTALTWRRLGRVATVTLVGASQLLLHKAFGLTESAGSCVTVVHEHAGHLANGATTLCAAPATTAGMPSMAHHGGTGLSMVAAHAVAAIVLGLVLARGEAAVWLLASWLVPPLPQPTPPPCALRPAPIWTPVTPFVAVFMPAGVGRRGPPRGSVLTAS